MSFTRFAIALCTVLVASFTSPATAWNRSPATQFATLPAGTAHPEGITVDAGGNLYVANGQVFVYAPDGKLLRRIDVPARPLQLVIGGPDRRTLFILTHHALYSTPIG